MTKRALIVEDDALIGLDLVELLSDELGLTVCLATTVTEAMNKIQNAAYAFAVLDVNLANETSEAIAHELRLRGTPFVVLSGASARAVPSGMIGAPFLSKPVQPDDLLAELRKLSVSVADAQPEAPQV